MVRDIRYYDDRFAGAIAYWWARLDERVRRQVNGQVNQQMDQKLVALDDRLQKYTDQKMVEQNKTIVEAFNDQKKILVEFQDEVEQNERMQFVFSQTGPGRTLTNLS